MARPRAAAALPRVAGAWRRAALLVPAALLVLLARPAGAATAPIRKASYAPDGSFLGELVVLYELGVTGVPDLTASLQSAVAERLATDTAVLEPAAAAGGGSVSPAVSAALKQPFTTIFATKIERTSKGKPIPGAHAVIKVHPLLTGEQSAGVDVTARIVAALKESPEVSAVVKHFPSKPDSYCGSWNKAFCPAVNGVYLCCSAFGKCGYEPDACQYLCNPIFGACFSSVIPRGAIFNSANLASKMINQLFIEATVLDASRTPLTTKDLATGKGIVDPGYSLMILDTGVDEHISLFVDGCRNFNPDMQEQDRGRAECEDFGAKHHGTHVAGIAGARNRATGPWGVAPGARLFAATANSMYTGDGSTPGDLEAIRWVLANNDVEKIVVINMSFGDESYDLADSNDAKFIKAFCQAISDTVDSYGVVFVASAGNDGKYIPANKLPVACPRVIAATNLVLDTQTACTSATVTAADKTKYNTRSCTPSAKSNWVRSVDTDLVGRTIAAPGTNVWSTIKTKSYQLKSGTSMAAPHIAGAAFRCFNAGECRFGTFLDDGGEFNMERVLNATVQRNRDPSFQWTSTVTTYDKFDGVARYYGPLLWANKW